jgi:protein-disulfide isomerase
MLPIPEIDSHDHVDGPSDAPVTLLEYADFECPVCVLAYPEIERARAKFPGKLRFVYRHVPRGKADGFTKQAAEASEAAAAQGQFWPMYRALYEHPEQHQIAQLVENAKAIGLDVPRFERELNERVYAPRVHELAVRAIRNGIVGTPTLFINGVKFEQRPAAVALERAIAEQLEASKAH